MGYKSNKYWNFQSGGGKNLRQRDGGSHTEMDFIFRSGGVQKIQGLDERQGA